MPIDITKNGAPPRPTGTLVSTSWVRDDYATGRRRFKLYAMQSGVAATPIVIGEATMEVPNLEVARILVAGLGEMLNRQPPEILTLGGTK